MNFREHILSTELKYHVLLYCSVLIYDLCSLIIDISHVFFPFFTGSETDYT